MYVERNAIGELMNFHIKGGLKTITVAINAITELMKIVDYTKCFVKAKGYGVWKETSSSFCKQDNNSLTTFLGDKVQLLRLLIVQNCSKGISNH